jgi:hypothetical protein
MATVDITHPHVSLEEVDTRHHVRQAYQILHWGFVVAPAIAGADKFFNLLTHWDKYLSPTISSALPISASSFMGLVGIVELGAAMLVLFRPKIGAYVVAGWLAAIIVNLVLVGGYLDVALRDFGLMLGALALGRLSHELDHGIPARHPNASA